MGQSITGATAHTGQSGKLNRVVVTTFALRPNRSLRPNRYLIARDNGHAVVHEHH